MVKKEELLHKLGAKDVRKIKMIIVAGQTFIEFEKEFDNANQLINGNKD